MHPNFMILYVNNPLSSSSFYEKILDQEPLDTSPNFVLFALKNGLMLGLWSRHTVEPAVTTAGSSAELAFVAEDISTLEKTYQNWTAMHVPIVQKPTDLDFGRSFVALDPDGHRLRVFVPNAEQGG